MRAKGEVPKNLGFKMSEEQGHLVAHPEYMCSQSWQSFARLRGIALHDDEVQASRSKFEAPRKRGPRAKYIEPVDPVSRNHSFSINRNGQFRFHASKNVRTYLKEDLETISEKQMESREIDDEGIEFSGTTEIHFNSRTRIDNAPYSF